MKIHYNKRYSTIKKVQNYKPTQKYAKNNVSIFHLIGFNPNNNTDDGRVLLNNNRIPNWNHCRLDIDV